MRRTISHYERNLGTFYKPRKTFGSDYVKGVATYEEMKFLYDNEPINITAENNIFF